MTSPSLHALHTALALSNPLRLPCAPPPPFDADAALLCAHALGTAEAAARALQRLHLPCPPQAAALYLESLARNMLSLAAADAARDALQAAGLRAMPLKGYAFLQDLYAHDVGARRMFDLDLLIDRATFTDAAAILLREGWHRPLDAPVIGRLNVEALFVTRYAGQEVRLELHRALTFPGRYRASPAQLWASARHTPAGWRMDPHDALLYLALHKAQHGWRNDCRDLVDATNLVDAAPIDWDRLRARAHQWGCAAAAWLFLSRARRAFALDAPDDALAALRPHAARAALLQEHIPDPTATPDFRQRRNNQRPLPRKVAESLLLTDTPARELAALTAISLRGAADAAARRARLSPRWLQPLDRVPLWGAP
jgi:hypothetical protein